MVAQDISFFHGKLGVIHNGFSLLGGSKKPGLSQLTSLMSSRVALSIRIQVTKQGSSTDINLVVSDTGIGIEPSIQPKVFDMFFQGDTGYKRQYGGLGIGLTICQSLVKVMGGKIKVNSLVGQGTNVSMTFPVSLEKLVNEPKRVQKNKNQLPILIVEDNAVNQKVLGKMLQKLGEDYDVANHGQQALQKLQEKKFCLILMDLQMPVMDGFECTNAIRTSAEPYRNIPIIAVTANTMDADRERCFDIGMNHFLKKPVKLDQVKNVIDGV